MPAIDLSASTRDGVGAVSAQAPATRGEAVVPHDVTDLTNVSRALWVGGAGDVAAVMLSGDVVVFSAVPAGTLLPIRVSRINDTGTSATLMVAIS